MVVLLREHGMLWNTGGKNQVKNMCMHRVWSTHGFGGVHGVGGTHGVSECMRLDLIEGSRAGLREWQDVAGSRWLLVVQFSSRCLREEWRSEASFSGAALSCYTQCILACAACRTHFFSVCR